MSDAIVKAEQRQIKPWNDVLLPELTRASGMLQKISKFAPADVQKLITCVQAAARKTPELFGCEPSSIALALTQAAAIRLFPNTPANHAYLIPYGKECQLQVSYPGMIMLAKRTGLVSSVKGVAVYEADVFDLEEGTSPKIVHKPALRKRGGDNDIIGAYGLIQLRDGSVQFRWLDREAIDKRRAMSKAKNSPWNTWFKEMTEKTAIKYVLKQCDLSNEDGERLMLAVHNDDRQEAGEAPDLPFVDGAEDLLPPTTSVKGSLAERAES